MNRQQLAALVLTLTAWFALPIAVFAETDGPPLLVLQVYGPADERDPGIERVLEQAISRALERQVPLSVATAAFRDVGGEETLAMAPADRQGFDLLVIGAYSVVGDMVNLASRLEGLTKMYDVPILVSESVANEVKDMIPCRWIDTVRVKGKSDATQIYAPHRSEDKNQHDGWALQERGMTYCFQGDFREAARYLPAARKLLPKDPIIHRFLIQCKRLIATPPPPGWSGITTIGEE